MRTTARTARKRRRSSRAPEYVGADYRVIANSMTGTFEYGRGDKRALPDFNVFFRYYANYPYYSDAVWYLTQMRRWGQIPEGKTDAVVPRDGEEGVSRRTCTCRPRRLLVAEKKAKRGGLPIRERRLPRADEGVHRRHRVRRPQAQRLHREADDRPQGPAEDRERQCRRQVTCSRRQRGAHAADAAAESAAAPRPTLRRRAKPRFPRVNAAIDATIRALSLVGLGFLKPIVAMCRGEDPRVHLRQLWLDLGVPLVAIAAFLFAVEPGVVGHPDQPRADSRAGRGVGADAGVVGGSPRASARRRRRSTSARRSATPRGSPRIRTRRSRRAKYTGKPTYIDQIFTSLKTVFAGFLLATLIAVPLGILCGAEQDHQRDVQSADPDLQAGVAARVAAASSR